MEMESVGERVVEHTWLCKRPKSALCHSLSSSDWTNSLMSGGTLAPVPAAIELGPLLLLTTIELPVPMSTIRSSTSLLNTQYNVGESFNHFLTAVGRFLTIFHQVHTEVIASFFQVFQRFWSFLKYDFE